MRHALARALAVCPALALFACDSPPTAQPDNAAPAMTQMDAASPAAAPGNAAGAAMEAPISVDTLRLEGLGALVVGAPIPAGSGWEELGAQISEACRTVMSPDYPGVYALVEGGKVRRISVGGRSQVKLVEGLGVGASEAQVRAAFPGFRETPHKYVAAPAKYLTAPNAGSGDPALRFEIGENGRVSQIHVGTMPALGYVEGCA